MSSCLSDMAAELPGINIKEYMNTPTKIIKDLSNDDNLDQLVAKPVTKINMYDDDAKDNIAFITDDNNDGSKDKGDEDFSLDGNVIIDLSLGK